MLDAKPGLYKHFKNGPLVVVYGTAKHSEALHMCLVVYREVGTDHGLLVRPVEMFLQNIQRPTYTGPRFWRVGTLEDALQLLDGQLIEGGNEPVDDIFK
jgi:hypothetical protein